MEMPFLQEKQTPLTAQQYVTQFGAEELTKSNLASRAWFLGGEGAARYFAKWVKTGDFAATLAKDVAICTAPPHPAIVPVLNVIRTLDGMLVISPHVEGAPLEPKVNREVFFKLPLQTKLRALNTLFAALASIVAQGWVIEDFYEGNVIYNFTTEAIHLFDFEFYHHGPYTLAADQTFGSSRLLAPEERVRGSWIDETSNVYTLGRYAICALCPQTDEGWLTGFPGATVLAQVLRRATNPERSDRYQTVQEFTAEFEWATRVDLA